MKLDLVMPLRAADHFGKFAANAGLEFSPRLNLDIVNVAGQARLELRCRRRAAVRRGQYHEYFYSVAPRFATAARPLTRRGAAIQACT